MNLGCRSSWLRGLRQTGPPFGGSRSGLAVNMQWLYIRRRPNLTKSAFGYEAFLSDPLPERTADRDQRRLAH
jgi:hypothetical protein